MKSTRFITIAVVISLFATAFMAQAAVTPTLSLSSAGGDSVNINVNADPNANVMFYYNVASSAGMQSMTLGVTNSSGYFSTTLNSASYNINSGQSVYVIVDGAQSITQTWPTPTGTPTLNNTSVTVGLGQSVDVSEQGSSAPIYMSTNATPAVANVQTNGSEVVVTGEEIGSTNAQICYTGTASNCVTLYITVQSTNASSLSFSENNFTAGIGQTTNVTVSGGNGSYSLTGNSDASIAGATINGDVITVSPFETGNANITACDTNNNCATLYVTVNSSGSSNSGNSVTFGVSNPTLVVGQSLDVTLSGASNYYISSNPSSNVVEVSINGSTLDLYGENAGSDSLVICASGGNCNSLYVTVNGSTASTVTTSATNTNVLSTIQSMQSQLAQIVTQIQSMVTTLNQLAASVGATSNTTTVSTSASTGSLYNFTQFLSVGSQGADVTALQEYLAAKGFFSGTATGYYGGETQSAVEAYQTAHNIDPAGYVGPSTRAALNAGE